MGSITGIALIGDVREGGVHTGRRGRTVVEHRCGVHTDPVHGFGIGMKHSHHETPDGFAGAQRHHGRVLRAGQRATVGLDCPPAGIHRCASQQLIPGQAQDGRGGRIGIDQCAGAVLIDHPLPQHREQLLVGGLFVSRLVAFGDLGRNVPGDGVDVLAVDFGSPLDHDLFAGCIEVAVGECGQIILQCGGGCGNGRLLVIRVHEV